MNNLSGAVLAIATSVIGVAIIAVLVSKNAQTSTVIDSFGKMFTNILGAATAPVTGSTTTNGGVNSALNAVSSLSSLAGSTGYGNYSV